MKKQSDEHSFRTADFHLAVVISGREMSAMFGRVTFSYRFVLAFLSHVGCTHSCFHLVFINNIYISDCNIPAHKEKLAMPSQTILAPQAILPDSLRPQTATIVFDTDSGIITSVTPGIHQGKGEANVWKIEEGKVLLPGLIEYVHYPFVTT